QIYQRLNLIVQREPRVDLARLGVQLRDEVDDLSRRARRQRAERERSSSLAFFVELHPRVIADEPEPERAERARFDVQPRHCELAALRRDARLQLGGDALVERGEQYTL